MAVESILEDAVEWFETEESGLRQARGNVAKTRIATARMARSLRRGNAEYDAEDLLAAQAAQSNAEQNLDALLEDFRSDAFSTLSVAQKADLGRVAAARLCSLDPEYLMVEISEADRVTAERCVRIDAQRRSENDQTVLESIEGTAKFITASAARQVNETTVTTSWEQFWHEE